MDIEAPVRSRQVAVIDSTIKRLSGHSGDRAEGCATALSTYPGTVGK
ncbi:hypothetical protein [Mycobacterium nebraskense]|nr:hypothetical protein [Mycobacterium nebraskense]